MAEILHFLYDCSQSCTYCLGINGRGSISANPPFSKGVGGFFDVNNVLNLGMCKIAANHILLFCKVWRSLTA